MMKKVAVALLDLRICRISFVYWEAVYGLVVSNTLTAVREI